LVVLGCFFVFKEKECAQKKRQSLKKRQRLKKNLKEKNSQKIHWEPGCTVGAGGAVHYY
jgi:hypothetical protein